MPERKGRTERYLTTVLMTDIVGSTEHAAEMGDSDWRDLIAQHHRIVRAALKAHRGREIDTAGDGFFAIFDAPAAAVRCALDIARDVRILGIDIRAGVHTGEVEQAGSKVAGIAVPIASRIMAAAGPAEILVSATVRDLAAGAGLDFEDRGTRELKGVPGEWHIYAATSPALVDDAQAAEDSAALRAAAVRRRRARPIWQRRPRLVSAVAVGLVIVLVGGALLVWQPWLPPALAEIGSDSVGVIDSSRSVITASIKVDSQPAGLSVSGDSAWVANRGSNTVSQIDTASHGVKRVVDVGSNPVGVVAIGGSIWVANSGARTVSRINEATGRVVDTITAGNGPLAVAATGDTIWAANYTDSTLTRIESQSGSTLAPIAVATGPVAIAADTTGVWVASADAAAVTHLDAASGVTLAAPIALPSRPIAIAAGAGGIWVASADGTVTRIDPTTNRVTATTDVGGSLSSIVVAGNTVWVGDRDGFLVKIDAANPSAPAVRVGTTNSPVALAADGDSIWVAAGAASSSHRGGVLRVVDTQSPDLDVTDLTGVAKLQADGLVAYRHVGGSAGGSLVADLASSVPKPTDGGLRYTFHLRSGLRYADGSPVLASDFRRALERSFTTDPFAPGPGLFGDVLGADRCTTQDGQPVRVCDLSAGVLTDDQAGVVTFVLSKPNSEFLYQLAGLNAYPVPPSVPMNTSIEGAFPGTGPYTVMYHDEGIVKLTRNPNFSVWDADARPDAFADEIDFITQPDPEAAVSMVERGDADYIRLTVADRPSDATLDRIRSQLTAQLRFAPDAPGSVTLNTSIAPFNSLEARQAINMAIDRQHMVDLRGGSSAAAISCQYLPSGWPAHQPYCPYTTHPDPGGRWQAPDLDAARALVARSGTLGAKVVVGPTLDIFADEREYVATVLAELGYDVTTDTDTSGEHVSSVHEAGQVQVSVWEWFKATLTPADQLAPFTCERSAGTFSYYCDPAFDALVAEAANLQATDVAAANEKWAQADRMLVDAAPWAPVFNEGSDFISSRVGNYQYHLFYGALLDQMWVQ